MRILNRMSAPATALSAVMATTLLAAAAHAQSWPFPADMSPTFQPRFIDVSITDAKALGQLQLTERAIYGRIGLYAYCETSNGLRALAPSGGLSNNILNLNRDQATTDAESLLRGSRGTRRFAYDSACLSGNGRIALQIQTNLKRRGPIPRRDTDFGYRASMIYLDRLPGATQTRDGIRAVSRGLWELNASETVTRRDLYRPFGQDFQIAGRIELAR
jgi:hypothetical protein